MGVLGLGQAVTRGLLRLGDDLVVVLLRGLHQDPRLLAGVADDLLGVRGGVVEQLAGQLAFALGPRVQLLGLRAEGGRLLLGPGLELVGDVLGMPQQCCGAIRADRVGAGGDRTVGLNGHGRILPNERPLE